MVLNIWYFTATLKSFSTVFSFVSIVGTVTFTHILMHIRNTFFFTTVYLNSERIKCKQNPPVGGSNLCVSPQSSSISSQAQTALFSFWPIKVVFVSRNSNTYIKVSKCCQLRSDMDEVLVVCLIQSKDI